MTWGAGHVFAMISSLKNNRRKRPNMRLEFDYNSRKGVRNFRYRKTKPLSAQQSAHWHETALTAKKRRQRKQLLGAIVSVVILFLVVWGFTSLFYWLVALPGDIF